MTTSRIAVAPAVPATPQAEDPPATGNQRKRTNRGLLALGLANWMLVGVVVWSSEGLVRRQVLEHRPAVDPEFVGVAVGSAMFSLFLGMGVVLTVAQLGARFADGQIANLWDRDARCRATVARLAVGLTAGATLAAYLLFSAEGDRIGGGMPLLAAPAIAAVAHLPSLRQWRAAAVVGKVTSVIVTVGMSMITLAMFGR